MGIIFGSASHLIRQVTGSYLLNIIISSLVLIALIKLYGPRSITEAVTAGLMAMSIYLAIEFLNIKLIQMLTGIDPIRMSQDFILRLLWFLPQLLAATGVALAVRFFLFHLPPETDAKGINNEEKYL